MKKQIKELREFLRESGINEIDTELKMKIKDDRVYLHFYVIDPQHGSTQSVSIKISNEDTINEILSKLLEKLDVVKHVNKYQAYAKFIANSTSDEYPPMHTLVDNNILLLSHPVCTINNVMYSSFARAYDKYSDIDFSKYVGLYNISVRYSNGIKGYIVRGVLK